MKLIDIIPAQEVQAQFGEPLKVTLLGFSEIDKIAKISGNHTLSASLNIWNRIVQKRLKPVDPRALAKSIKREDPYIFRTIEDLIKAPVILDALHYSAVHQAQTVATVTIFRVFPNDLHLADISFVNPQLPLPAEKRTKLREYRGLGLLRTVIERMIRYAELYGLDYITLTAAFAELVPVFTRLGFLVEDNPVARNCLSSGECIPMEMPINLRQNDL